MTAGEVQSPLGQDIAGDNGCKQAEPSRGGPISCLSSNQISKAQVWLHLSQA